MRATNFKVGDQKAGFHSSYASQFRQDPNSKIDRITIDRETQNNLEASHWDHSRSWRKNFKSEANETFKFKSDKKNFSQDRHYTYQNTLNQGSTHYKFGEGRNQWMTMASTTFRDNSSERQPIFETNRVKNYQELNHYDLGKESYPKMTTTWTHFSKSHVLQAQSKTRKLAPLAL